MAALQFRDLSSYPKIPPPPMERKKKTPESVTKKVNELELHENTTDMYGYTITRVSGGWIYDRQHGSIFVPYIGDLKL